jgi:hypothetical protein
MVVEDREPEYVGRSSPGWAWLAVGLVVGAGLTVLVLRGGGDGVTATTVISADPLEEVPEGIAEVIEGFPDGLVAVSRSDGRSLQLLVWPLRGEPIVRTIPVGVSSPPGPVDFDVSADRIATLLPIPNEPHGVLYAGVPDQAGIVATEVTSYAWHDTDAAHLAYTTFADGELQVWTVSEPDDPQLVIRAVGIVGGLGAWGDWGFAVHDEERDAVVLFTGTGEIKATHPGRILDSDGEGWLAVDDGGVTLVSSGGGVDGSEGVSGEAISARFSPDAEEIALLTSDGARVVRLGDGATLVESADRPGLPEVAWTSDGRFVAYPAVRGIAVLDTADQSSERVLVERVFTGLGVLPVGAT